MAQAREKTVTTESLVHPAWLKPQDALRTRIEKFVEPTGVARHNADRGDTVRRALDRQQRFLPTRGRNGSAHIISMPSWPITWSQLKVSLNSYKVKAFFVVWPAQSKTPARPIAVCLRCTKNMNLDKLFSSQTGTSRFQYLNESCHTAMSVVK